MDVQRALVRENVLIPAGNAKIGDLDYQIVATHYVPWRDGPQAEREMTIDVRYDTTTLKKGDVVTCRVTVRYNRPGTAHMTIVDLGIPPASRS